METKKYTNGEITVVWTPQLCIHSTLCWKGGLPEVFNPQAHPWINMQGASSEKIIAQVEKCPTKALSYFRNDEKTETPRLDRSEDSREFVVEVVEKGPLLVHGNITLKDKGGCQHKVSKVTAFCRCGASGNKPYCDGMHTKIDFNG